MKKKVSVREFKEYCRDHNISQISFCAENQEWCLVSDPCKFNLSFPSILVYENPDVIYLRHNGNIVYFDRVKYIEIDSNETVLGDTFTICCGNENGYDVIKQYKLIAV